MKILEAWSRGVVVVATPTAARGLDVHHGKQLLLAEKVEEFVAACELLTQPKEQAKLVRAGRLHLAKDHSLKRFAEGFEEVCASLELKLT
jgi:glycosyltransferase involved in cell wall biosynthesis